MEDLNAYTPEEIILANLAELSGRFDALREQLSAHLRELALELSAGMGDGTALLSQRKLTADELNTFLSESYGILGML